MQGAYGLVCSGTNTDTGKKVAIKKIPKAFEDTIDCKRLLREIKILRHFKHDNVLGLHDILPPPDGSAKAWKDVYIVSELMDTDLCARHPLPKKAAAARPSQRCHARAAHDA